MDNFKTMIIDSQTFDDLEIFGDSSGSDGLFQLLDSTQTLQGRQVLRARIKAPLVEAEDIREVQQALDFLRKYRTEVPVDACLMNTVDKYFHSNIEVVQWSTVGARLHSLRSLLRYPEIHQELRNGVNSVGIFVKEFGVYCTQMLAAGSGEYLEKHLKVAISACDAIIETTGDTTNHSSVLDIGKRDSVYRIQHRFKVGHLIKIAANLDALKSMSEFGLAFGYSVPEIVTGGPVFKATNLHHPLVKSAVGNPLELSASANVVYLTGPNMAGKTTYLKTLGIVQLLAQTGMRVPADYLRCTTVDCLFVGLATSDNLSEGISYYLAEVRRVKVAAEHLAAGHRSLMLFDETFKGTNVLDASEATRLLVEACLRYSDSFFVFSSHLAGLADGLAKEGAVLKSFSGRIIDGHPKYEYTISDGASDQRMGLHLLEQEGVLTLLGYLGHQQQV